jgi:hypothetical protein
VKTIVHRIKLVDTLTTVELPVCATIIHAAWKAGEGRPSLWYSFNAADLKNTEQRRFELSGTGHELISEGDAIPVGSFIAPDGFHVFHVFEIVS